MLLLDLMYPELGVLTQLCISYLERAVEEDRILGRLPEFAFDRLGCNDSGKCDSDSDYDSSKKQSGS